MNQQAKDNIIRARVSLQQSHPFFSYLALHLNPIETTEVPSMGVDARGNMYYNADWVLKLSLEEVKGVVCHEVMHVAFEHLKWLQGKDAQLSNIAQDLVINDALVTNSVQLPKEGLCPNNHEFNLGGVEVKDINKKCWEQIYAELERHCKKQKVKGGGFDEHKRPENGDEPSPGGGGKDGQLDSEKGVATGGEKPDWKQVINEAYSYAKLQGKAPAGLDRYIEELTYPKLNWKAMLQKFIIRELPHDFCYTRPSKRSVAMGVFMPSIVRENLEIAIGVDTSGSMSPKDLQECVSEVIGIIKAYDCVKLTVIACDAEVNNVDDVQDESDLINFKFGGGGGTSFIPVFNWLEENKPNLKLLIFFTDGYGDFPDEPKTKTLWVISPGGLELDKIPFGESVKMNELE